VSVAVRISHAIIGGSLDLRYATFEAELSVTDSTFTDEADLSFATFKRSATFEGSEFQHAGNFRAVHAEGDFEIMRASFADGASFQDLHVDEVLDGRGATFGRVDFERIEVAKGALFRRDDGGNRTTFGGEAIFRGARITSGADFDGAEFKGVANFDALQVDGIAFFRTDAKGQRVQFGDEAIFRGAHTTSNAEFTGAEFKGRASFDRLQVDGSAFFRSEDQGQRVQFGDEAIFSGAHICGQVSFLGAEFKGRASFDSLQVDGPALFRSDDQGQRVQFGSEAIFRGAHFGDNAEFDGAEFRDRAMFDNLQVDGSTFFRPDGSDNRVTFLGPAGFSTAIFGAESQFTNADFKATVGFDNAHFKGAARFKSAEFAVGSKSTFIGARFERGAYFNSAQFLGETDFTAAVADRDAQFTGAQISGRASFREARFQAVFFGEPSQTQTPRRLPWRPKKKDAELLEPAFFGGLVDLRGFTYDRIYVLLRDLFPKLTPFDRQPYSQLEGALRKVGDDRRAHLVYLERRRVERKHKFRPHTIHLWLLDWLYKLGANYGVRPYQLVTYALACILFGAALFCQPGALEAKKESSAEAPAKIDPAGVGLWKGLGVSVHYFLPMDTPVGADLVPTAARVPIRVSIGNWGHSYQAWPSPSWYATIFLRVTGSILMGIGLAATTGLLRRIAP
jgi:hypothetical protein